MARNFDGTDDIDWGDVTYMDGKTELTVFSWVYPTSLTGDQDIISKWGTLASNTTMILQTDDSDSDQHRMLIRDDGGVNSATIVDDSAPSTNTWQTILANFLGESADGANIYLDGIASSNNPLDTTGIDAINNSSEVLKTGSRSSGADPYNGRLAYQAIWDIQIENQSIITALANGVHPFVIHHDNLLFFCAIWGNDSPEFDLGNKDTGTVTGTTKAAHAPVELLENYL